MEKRSCFLQSVSFIFNVWKEMLTYMTIYRFYMNGYFWHFRKIWGFDPEFSTWGLWNHLALHSSCPFALWPCLSCMGFHRMDVKSSFPLQQLSQLELVLHESTKEHWQWPQSKQDLTALLVNGHENCPSLGSVENLTLPFDSSLWQILTYICVVWRWCYYDGSNSIQHLSSTKHFPIPISSPH